jgi:hypothetical protein
MRTFDIKRSKMVFTFYYLSSRIELKALAMEKIVSKDINEMRLKITSPWHFKADKA